MHIQKLTGEVCTAPRSPVNNTPNTNQNRSDTHKPYRSHPSIRRVCCAPQSIQKQTRVRQMKTKHQIRRHVTGDFGRARRGRSSRPQISGKSDFERPPRRVIAAETNLCVVRCLNRPPGHLCVLYAAASHSKQRLGSITSFSKFGFDETAK